MDEAQTFLIREELALRWNRIQVLEAENAKLKLALDCELNVRGELKAELTAYRWIPVGERLPEDDSPVLLWLDSGNVIQGIPSADLYSREGKLSRYITHWKPITLPE